MTGAGERPNIELRGARRRGGVRGAVVVLERASRSELRRASAFAGLLTDSSLLVAVNGGLRTCRAARRRPDLFVGDVDSAKRVPKRLPSIVYARDKSFSDLAGALSELRRRGVQVVTIAGLLGGRLDHEWANLFELGRRAGWFAGILAPTDRGTVLITSHGCRAVTVRNRSVSLLSLCGGATVSLLGTRWSLRRQRILPGSHGLSNVTGTSLDLVVYRGSVALVFPPSPRRARKRQTT
jgi:thiamine pyrophosphokinase